jgi:hypothetical protein
MRPSPVLLFLLLYPGFARADCVETCNRNLGRCAQRCVTDPKCYGTCQKQSDTCMGVCQARGEITASEKLARGKCPGPGGKPVPCDELKALSASQFAKIIAKENAAAEQRRKRPQRKPSAKEMEEFRELGLNPSR